MERKETGKKAGPFERIGKNEKNVQHNGRATQPECDCRLLGRETNQQTAAGTRDDCGRPAHGRQGSVEEAARMGDGGAGAGGSSRNRAGFVYAV